MHEPSSQTPNPSVRLQQTFERDGYVHVPGCVSMAELGGLRAELSQFRAQTLATLPSGAAFLEDLQDPKSLKQVQQLWCYLPTLQELKESGRLAAIAERLLGEPVVAHNAQLFLKSRSAPEPTPAHQDGAYFPLVVRSRHVP